MYTLIYTGISYLGLENWFVIGVNSSYIVCSEFNGNVE